jgi:anaerobic selenocysteine-containing dehydrogenase/Fe-S-cluster-containing dehydrogenase component
MTDGIKRRDFLKVLGVSGAGATLAGCSTQNAERLLPYVTMSEDITPGVSTWYTTVCDGCAAQCGMWVRTREGRVVKLEGNPNHPVSAGALCARGHATLQHLYDPDRYAGPMIREGGVLRQATWEEAEALLAQRIQSAAGNALFIGGALGPTMTRLVDDFVGSVGGRRVQYDALSDAPLREATRIAFGVDALPRYDIARARFLISFGDDFLETGPSPVEHGRAFARMSAADEHGSKGRFVFAGPRLSLTGLNADEWIPIRAGAEAALALGMAAAIAEDGAAAGPYASVVRAYDVRTAANTAGVSEDTVRELAERFAQGPSLALGPGVGAHHRNATAANVAALILNFVAGNVGRTVHVEGGPNVATRPFSEMESAIRSMAGGQVGVVMVHGANPAYSLPASSGFAEAFGSVGFKVSFASAPDETSAMADLILPDRHFLESWGDSMPRAGVTAIRQPTMQPVPHFDSKQTGDVILSVASRMGHALGGATFYEYLRSAHRAMHGGNAGFEAAWREALRSGVVARDTRGAPTSPAQLRGPDAALTFDVPDLDGDGDLTLLVHPSSRFGAGEFANSPWMQELPDPVSKVMWHSWLEMNPSAAEARGIREGDIVTVASPHGSVELPIRLYPGIREDSVAVALGGGHTDFGRWANGNGVNAVTLLPAVAEQPSGGFVTLATTVTVTPTGQRRRNVTNEGSADQHDRPIAPAVALADLGRESAQEEEAHGELKELQGGGGFVPVPAEGGAATAFPLEGSRHGIYANAHDERARWGMAIDLDKCTGCSACVSACQAENNIPWVGEQQALMGREMHWMRIERYYEHVDATEASHLDVRFLPMLCQHCGNAPCEPVCPVFATYHTPEGVNAQVYNRCVGTRYCANNCPYKVRVFNWYRYTDENVPEPMNWQWNPDVTVRSNGVMEKCSFCMQRIREAENRAVVEGRDSRIPRDGEIVPACQQSCPAEAIVFGNLRDPDSRVSQVVRNERTYRVLDEIINTQPAVSYLKKVTFHEVESGGHD